MNSQKATCVYDFVKAIPRGKVATYGQIATSCLLKTPRQVGYYLHRNPDPDHIPCHRVVNSKGRTAANFAFGLSTAQEQLLKREGVAFIRGHVDLASHLWKA
jgi:O-6-methylguanine DNA methyltransferase